MLEYSQWTMLFIGGQQSFKWTAKGFSHKYTYIQSPPNSSLEELSKGLSQTNQHFHILHHVWVQGLQLYIVYERDTFTRMAQRYLKLNIPTSKKKKKKKKRKKGAKALSPAPEFHSLDILSQRTPPLSTMDYPKCRYNWSPNLLILLPKIQ